jgi:hypothetical protein
MFIVRKHRLREGLNHISMPLGAETLTIGALPSGLHLWYRGPDMAPTLENRIFVVAEDHQRVDEPMGYDVRHIGSLVAAHISAHVFELVLVRGVTTTTGDQLVGEGR